MVREMEKHTLVTWPSGLGNQIKICWLAYSETRPNYTVRYILQLFGTYQHRRS